MCRIARSLGCSIRAHHGDDSRAGCPDAGNDSGSEHRRKAALARPLWVLAALLGAFPVQAQEADDPWTPPGMYVGIGTHSLHVHCLGDETPTGPTVIFESGLGGTSLDWSRVQPPVASFARSCSYDRAGYGWSESGPLPRDARRLSDELAALLVYASLPPPYVLVAHSFGGFPVRLFANDHPERVAALVLVDTTHEQQFKRFNAGASLAPRGRSFVIANHWAVPDGLPPGLRSLAQRLALRPRAVRALYAELADMRLSATQVQKLPGLPPVPVRLLSRGPAAPTLDGGSVDAEQRWLDAQRDLAARYPGATLRLAPNSGHHVHLDAPDLVVEAVRDVVAGLEDQRPPPARPAARPSRQGRAGGVSRKIFRRRDVHVLPPESAEL